VRRIIDQVAANEAMRRRLAEDPLGVARTEGYAASIEDVASFLGAGHSPMRDIQESLARHLSRFDHGKWYQSESESDPID
jgi:hypothetical protein